MELNRSTYNILIVHESEPLSEGVRHVQLNRFIRVCLPMLLPMLSTAWCFQVWDQEAMHMNIGDAYDPVFTTLAFKNDESTNDMDCGSMDGSMDYGSMEGSLDVEE